MTIRKTSSKKVQSFIDFSPLVRKPVVIDEQIRTHLAQTRRRIRRLMKQLDAFDGKLEALEAEDNLSNFEIQVLMSQFNQSERLASSVQKKRDDTANAVIGKVG